MDCPHCHSKKTHKFGFVKDKQRYHCKKCGRYFQSSYEQQGYSPDVKKICLKMYLNGMGFRGIERITGIHHTTIMNWVSESGEELPEDESEEPELAELDELQTYIGRKTEKVWIWTAIDRHAPGILAMEIGARSGGTFEKLWRRIKAWDSRRYLTDGYCVYANYIDPAILILEKNADLVLYKHRELTLIRNNFWLNHEIIEVSGDKILMLHP